MIFFSFSFTYGFYFLRSPVVFGFLLAFLHFQSSALLRSSLAANLVTGWVGVFFPGFLASTTKVFWIEEALA